MSLITLDDLSLREIELAPPCGFCGRPTSGRARNLHRAGAVDHALQPGSGAVRAGPDHLARKGRLYRKVLENRLPVVSHAKAFQRTSDGMREFAIEDSSPFAGSTTTRFKGVPLYPEFLALGCGRSFGPSRAGPATRIKSARRMSPS